LTRGCRQHHLVDEDGPFRLSKGRFDATQCPCPGLYFLSPLNAEFFLATSDRDAAADRAARPVYAERAADREVARRTGRGWPTIALLGLGPSDLRGALLTQSLFNPGYLDATCWTTVSYRPWASRCPGTVFG